MLCCCCWAVDEEGIHILDDGNFYYEVDGLPEADLDEDDGPMQAKSTVQPKKPDKVKFSSSPMKVLTLKLL